MIRRVFTKVLDGLGLTYGTFGLVVVVVVVAGGGVFLGGGVDFERPPLVVSDRLRL